MVDLEKSKKEFENYVSHYDMSLIKLNRKRSHSLRVMDISTKIAQSQNLSEDGIQIATLIGLLHDIARFEQYMRYGSLRDAETIDHGDFGVEILEKDNYLRKYIETTEYDNIILKAIKNHNKFEIEKNLTKKEELYSKIIRDADKLDIFYEAVEMFWKDSKHEVENLKLSAYVEEEILKEKTVKRKKGIKINQLDKVVTLLGFVYDLNFKSSFEIVKKENYINRIINQFDFKDTETKEKMENIRVKINKYLEEKL